jgi:hypothetical protein
MGRGEKWRKSGLEKGTVPNLQCEQFQEQKQVPDTSQTSMESQGAATSSLVLDALIDRVTGTGALRFFEAAEYRGQLIAVCCRKADLQLMAIQAVDAFATRTCEPDNDNPMGSGHCRNSFFFID